MQIFFFSNQTLSISKRVFEFQCPFVNRDFLFESLCPTQGCVSLLVLNEVILQMTDNEQPPMLTLEMTPLISIF